jgi:hypothetical protein
MTDPGRPDRRFHLLPPSCRIISASRIEYVPPKTATNARGGFFFVVASTKEQDRRTLQPPDKSFYPFSHPRFSYRENQEICFEELQNTQDVKQLARKLSVSQKDECAPHSNAPRRNSYSPFAFKEFCSRVHSLQSLLGSFLKDFNLRVVTCFAGKCKFLLRCTDGPHKGRVCVDAMFQSSLLDALQNSLSLVQILHGLHSCMLTRCHMESRASMTAAWTVLIPSIINCSTGIASRRSATY